MIPNLHGGTEEKVRVHVEYLWEPVQCSTCRVFGHKHSTCPKVDRSKPVKEGKVTMVEDEGFIRVERKKKWRPTGKIFECKEMGKEVETNGHNEAMQKDMHGEREEVQVDTNGVGKGMHEGNTIAMQNEGEMGSQASSSSGHNCEEEIKGDDKGKEVKRDDREAMGEDKRGNEKITTTPLKTKIPTLISVAKSFRTTKSSSNRFSILSEGDGVGEKEGETLSKANKENARMNGPKEGRGENGNIVGTTKRND